MGMTIKDVLQELEYLRDCGIFPYTDGDEIVDNRYINYAINIIKTYDRLRADYNERLKSDMVAMLTEIQLEIEELEKPRCHNASHADGCVSKWRVEGVIQQKINSLKGE